VSATRCAVLPRFLLDQ